jgi:hypothetical protein
MTKEFYSLSSYFELLHFYSKCDIRALWSFEPDMKNFITKLKISLARIQNCLRRRARWLCGQCARRAITEPKQCLQRPVIGWVTKIY